MVSGLVPKTNSIFCLEVIPKPAFVARRSSFVGWQEAKNDTYWENILSLSDTARRQKSPSQQKLGFWDGFYYVLLTSLAHYPNTTTEAKTLRLCGLALTCLPHSGEQPDV